MSPLPGQYRGEVASRYAYDDGAGEIGFVSSVSEPFCGDCHRARLSSEGALYTCLFATQGLDLRGPLRAGATDPELLDLLRNTWSKRNDRYSELRAGTACRGSAAAQGRDALHRWLSDERTHACRCARSPDDGRRGQQGRHAAHGDRGDARALSGGRRARAARRTVHTKKGPVFQTAIIAGVMAAKRTHELIPFCHPLGLERCDVERGHGRATKPRALHGRRASQDRRRDGSADRRFRWLRSRSTTCARRSRTRS